MLVGILADSVHSFAAKNGMLFCFYCSFKFQFADMSVCVYQRFSCVCASGGIIVGSDKYVNILAQIETVTATHSLGYSDSKTFYATVSSWDVSPPTIEDVGIKKIWSPPTFRTGCPILGGIVILYEKVKYGKTGIVT